jgi:hypothetical protein
MSQSVTWSITMAKSLRFDPVAKFSIQTLPPKARESMDNALKQLQRNNPDTSALKEIKGTTGVYEISIRPNLRAFVSFGPRDIRVLDVLRKRPASTIAVKKSVTRKPSGVGR